MATRFSIYRGKKTQIFLNVSFLSIFILYLIIHLRPPASDPLILKQSSLSNDYIKDQSSSFTPIHSYKNHSTTCSYVKSHKSCKSQGYIDYLAVFYCYCGKTPVLGYTLFTAWLLVLFYLLGSTASDYFCTSLEDLSTLLGLSPTIAGATLLSLGNGAPDVFSSTVSFIGAGGGDVGLNSVLGGAFVVSSGVAGVVAISIGSNDSVSIDKGSFIRDVCFFLLTLSSLSVILIMGRINLWGALGFMSIYVMYVFVVYLWHYLDKKYKVVLSSRFDEEKGDDLKESLMVVHDIPTTDVKKPLHMLNASGQAGLGCLYCREPLAARVFSALLLPLSLPRRLTIPVVSEERWSKPFAVYSAVLAPVFLSALWGPGSGEDRVAFYCLGSLTGVLLGLAALSLTESSNPPSRFRFPWLVGGFCMSLAWSYLIAKELVALLVALGKVMGISSTILGLTVLAWGNSIGDLVTNVAIAANGGADGAQTAMSGCYAGPLFNTLVGLGLPFVLTSWSSYPDSFAVPHDPTLYIILGFLACGLIWVLMILLKRGMKLDKFVGYGLLAIYFGFLSVRLSQELGVL